MHGTPKNVVLTFDDGLQSHYDVVKPLLEEHGFRGTFFITPVRMPRSDNLELEELPIPISKLKEMHDGGHEIGNHTMNHWRMATLRESLSKSVEDIHEGIQRLNDHIVSGGMPRPTSFCYPGYHCNRTLAEIVERHGFKFARTGYIYDEISGPIRYPEYYYPGKHSPVWEDHERLMLRSTGIVSDQYTCRHFVHDVDRQPLDTYSIFTFHGVRVDSQIEDFREILNFLYRNKHNVMLLRDVPI
jgi:peptidoglycan/xylan/chitin deacetylase (PgdA/CDA1 family)